MSRKIREMQKIIAMLKEIELARLADIQNEMETLELDINLLMRSKNDRTAPEGDHQILSVSSRALVDEKWTEWVDGKIRSGYGQLARLASDAEAQKQRARFAVGRDQSITSLIDDSQ